MNIEAAIVRRTRLVERRAEEGLLVQSIESLIERFNLSGKAAQEPETYQIVQQLYDRVVAAYPRLAAVKGRRILDLACGSNTSRAPSGTSRLDPTGGVHGNQGQGGFSSLFEPWLCRILASLGAAPVGVDMGDLGGEAFEHYQLDLASAGSLDFLPSRSFDAAHDSRLFGSPEFTARFAGHLASHARAMEIAREIARQEDRLLVEGGILIHSDAHELAGP